MLGILLKFYIFFNFHWLLVECFIPGLSVRKLDRKLQARKRQDTYEMCRLFTEENEKMKYFNHLERNKYKIGNRRRYKREVNVPKFPVNPALKFEDAKRVESIIDKLYQDIEEDGVQITYTHQNLTNLTNLTTPVPPETVNKTARRFNFAPAELLGPLPTTSSKIPDQNQNAIKNPAAKWKHGIIPYFIDSNTYDGQLAETIVKAFDYFEKATCIRLQKLRVKPTDKQSLTNVKWVYISNPSGIRQCVHSNEQKATNGVQMVVFGYDCMSQGEIVHEVMHVLGFPHEHTRSDRDHYITILWNNIKPGYKKYFKARPYDTQLNTLPYDYNSVLHYPARAFSKNGKQTVLAEAAPKLGQRESLSEVDVEKVSLIYGNECIDRNKEYLLKTCPSVVRADTRVQNVSQERVESYFKDRLWPFGIINFKFRDNMEFTTEEKENIKTVIRHIEKETCIRFIDNSDIYEELTAGDGSNDSDEIKNQAGQKMNAVYDSNEIHPRSIVNERERSKLNFLNEVSNTENESDIVSNSNEETFQIRRSLTNMTEASQKLFSNKSNITNEFIKTRKSDSMETTKIIKPKTQLEQTKTPLNFPYKPTKQRKANQKFPTRRHSEHFLVLARSPEAGCVCPSPGRPKTGDMMLHITTDCFNSVNDLLHIFVHVIGLDHQHNMHDRDSYLHILWENLTPEITEDLKQKLDPAASLGFPYDYQSVMHYPWLQIKNGVTDIMYPIWNDGWVMGHWQGLSSTDVQKLNLLYFSQCTERRQNDEGE